MTIAEQLIQEGRQEGRQEGENAGLQKGRQEGERLLLQRQLTRKFGELDFLTQEKVNHASEMDLERWAERILEAKSLAKVFGD